MGDREDDEELQMAMQMSLGCGSPPEPKRSKPPPEEESAEAQNRRLQRELMAAAAERRMRAVSSPATLVVAAAAAGSKDATAVESKSGTVAESVAVQVVAAVESESVVVADSVAIEVAVPVQAVLESGEELPAEVAEQLFEMVFGIDVPKGVLVQWSNQGIRFSTDPETSMGLVQHEGGPCGVLAALQGYVLKHLLFFPDGVVDPAKNRFYQTSYKAAEDFASITEERRSRALVHAMVDILFLCGTGKRAVVVSIKGFVTKTANGRQIDQNEMIQKALEGLLIESAFDLQKNLRTNTFDSRQATFDFLFENMLIFESRLGAMLFLISALLSRGLESVQDDRDDPSQPLVTAPFGHASQEIVNLLLCGEAVANVFDGRMDLGGGMFLKGIPTNVDVGFLTLLESLNLCKVGQYLKCPRWPIWVVGSESHYTLLFALDPSVQEEDELEQRESTIRRAFNAQDQSGGGGFINVDGFHQVLREVNVNFSADKLQSLCSSGFIVWSEFWQALLELDKSQGGMKDASRVMGKKQFDIYHFNGIAKSVLNSNSSPSSTSPIQRPRLCMLTVVVPPSWSQDDYLADVASVSSSTMGSRDDTILSLGPPVQMTQHAPLADCIRTRWPRATCSWDGDTPSIV